MRSPFQYKSTPDPHQREALKKTAHLPKAAYLMDPGTGKTKVALDTSRYLWGKNLIDLTVIVAPNLAHENWITQEVPPHLDGPVASAFYTAGRKNKELTAVLAADPNDVQPVVAVNIEMLSSKSGLAMVQSWIKGRRTMLHLDEAHFIRTPGAKRTRNLQLLGKSATYARLMTGTAICKGLENLYAPYRYLDPGIIGCQTYAEFKVCYCIERNFGTFSKIVGYHNQQQLFHRIDPVTYRCDLSVLNLPEPIFRTVQVPLSDEQRRLYDQLVEQYIAEVNAAVTVEAPHQLARLTKLQQIVSGHIRHEDGQWTALECPRLDIAVNEITQHTAKSIIWCAWKPDVEQLRDRLAQAGVGVATLYGEMNPAQCRDALARWRSDPECQVLIATPSKAGRSITLTEAKFVMYYSHSFDYEHYEQSIRRAHRRGQEDVVMIVDLVAPRTTDVTLLKSRSHKHGVASMVRDPVRFAAILRGDLRDAA